MINLLNVNPNQISLFRVSRSTCPNLKGQKFSIISRSMKRAAEESSSRTINRPALRESAISRSFGSSSFHSRRIGGTGIADLQMRLKFQENSNDYRRNLRPSAIHVRRICTDAKLKKFEDENNVKILLVDEPARTEIDKKILLTKFDEDLKEESYYLLTKCKKFLHKVKKILIFTDFGSGCPVQDNCAKNTSFPPNQRVVKLEEKPNTRELPEEIVTGFYLPSLEQVLRILNFRSKYPQEAKRIAYDADKIQNAKFNKEDRLELVNMKLEEEKQKIKEAEEAKKMAAEDKKNKK